MDAIEPSIANMIAHAGFQCGDALCTEVNRLWSDGCGRNRGFNNRWRRVHDHRLGYHIGGGAGRQRADEKAGKNERTNRRFDHGQSSKAQPRNETLG